MRRRGAHAAPRAARHRAAPAGRLPARAWGTACVRARAFAAGGTRRAAPCSGECGGHRLACMRLSTCACRMSSSSAKGSAPCDSRCLASGASYCAYLCRGGRGQGAAAAAWVARAARAVCGPPSPRRAAGGPSPRPGTLLAGAPSRSLLEDHVCALLEVVQAHGRCCCWRPGPAPTTTPPACAPRGSSAQRARAAGAAQRLRGGAAPAGCG